MEAVLLAILAVGSVVTAILVRLVALDVKALILETKLVRVAIANMGEPIYDVKRKQDEVLASVGKHTADVLALLSSIRDLNTKELTDRKEILQQANIKATSRVTSTKDWMANLEAAAAKEMLGLGGDRQ